MIPFAPCYTRQRLRAEVGPFLDLDIRPTDEVGTSHDSQPRHTVRVKIRTEVMSLQDLDNTVTRQRLDGERRPYYRIALASLRNMRPDWRKVKRQVSQMNETEAGSIKPLEPKDITITGLLAATLVVATAETRQAVVQIASMELAGLPQNKNPAFSHELCDIGKALADNIRAERPLAPWLDGAKKMKEAFTIG